MDTQNKKIDESPVDTNHTTVDNTDRFRLEVKTGKTVGGVATTQPIRLVTDWEDIENVPVIFCIDGGNASTTNWGTITKHTVEGN